MSTTDVRTGALVEGPRPSTVDMKLEVVLVPVSDVDRSKAFYERLGWRTDVDVRTDTFRAVQFTPTGSACSFQIGTHLTPAPPGSVQGLHLVVSDIAAAREDLVRRGVAAGPVFHCASGYACRFPDQDLPVPGRHPDRGTYGSFLVFSDPDGNSWLLQEVTQRFPGRVVGDTSYGSVDDLRQALERAAAAQGELEAGAGDATPGWLRYAEHMVQEQSSPALPQ